ncbi:MAG TPA: hypothetical protein ENK31_00515, partial [Nannocystis exedens]|nr:hypothetical protein [Nannocystis exedens]
NLCGGFAIGVFRDGGGWLESLELYGRLTIGDGLVAQIPALLVSLAAGVLVARVDRDPGVQERALAWLDPAMLLVPAALLGGLALVQGMPRGAFAAVACALVGGGLWLSMRTRPEQKQEPQRLVVSLGDPSLARSSGLRRALVELRSRSALALGVDVPEISASLQEMASPLAIEIRLGERSLSRRTLDSGSEAEVVVEVFRALMAHAEVLIDLHDLELELEKLRGSRPAIVREALRIRRAPEILALLRGFLRERVPIPPLDALLGAIAGDRRFAEESERGRWLELAREHTASFWLRDRLVAQEHLGPLSWVRPTPDAEEELRESLVEGIGGHALCLSAPDLEAWRAAVVGTDRGQEEKEEKEEKEEGEERDAKGGVVVVLTSVAGRPSFAALLRGTTPFTPVISVAEMLAAGLALPARGMFRWVSPP